MAINTYLSIITLNVKGFNAPIKGHRVPNEKKITSLYLLSTRDPLQNIKYTQTKNKGIEDDSLCKQGTKAGVAIHISEKKRL